jgi:hypothetical protein
MTMPVIGPVAPAALAARLAALATIDDPMTGNAAPAEVAARSKLWPEAARWQSIELKYVTEQGVRRVEEYHFVPAAGYTPVRIFDFLPVAYVFDRDASGANVARVYSAHELVPDRKPILPVLENLVPHRGGDDIFVRYFPVLHSAAMEPTLDLFESDGYIQHSNGETYRGRERLRADFTKFYATGGIKLRYCNKTDAGPITALECYMPSGRPAVAIYERGQHGLVAAARLHL